MNKTVKTSTAILLVLLVAVLAFFPTYFIMDSRLREAEADGKAYEKYAIVAEADRTIENYFIGDYDSAKSTEGAIDGMVAALGDQWSHYYNAEEYLSYIENSANAYVGIGVTVTKEDGGNVYIEKVTPGSPAEEEGLVPGDWITEVNGASIAELTLDDVKELIRGEEGTTVKLTVEDSNGLSRKLTVERRSIAAQVVTSRMMDENIGYVKIANFNQTAAEGFLTAVNSLIAEGAKGFVFDVRCNGGGRLSELLVMLDYLLPEGDLFVSIDKAGNEDVETSDAGCLEMPITVLINDMTYSAAEFFAAAIREYDWGTVVGQPSTGKGYSQIPIQLSDGSAIVLSTREYLTPHRVSLAGVGLAPDVAVEVGEEEYLNLYYEKLADEDDSQLQKALEIVRGEIK